jgi:hypothetical protein
LKETNPLTSTAQSGPLEEMLMDKRRGRYLGTEIGGKWWKRYTQEGWFARGKGEYWVDDEAFYFLRTLTRDPIVIPFDKVGDLKVGT